MRRLIQQTGKENKMEKLADISMFENLQAAANRSMASQMNVFNSFSEPEKEQKTEGLTQELNELQREMRAFVEGSSIMRPEDFWRRIEVQDRIKTVRGRLEQLRSKDTEGAFIDKCLDIEKQLDTFETQIKSAIDKVPQPKDLRNGAEAVYSSFSNPSK